MKHAKNHKISLRSDRIHRYALIAAASCILARPPLVSARPSLETFPLLADGTQPPLRSTRPQATKKPEPAESTVAAAEENFLKGRFQEVITSLAPLAKAYPNNEKLWILIGRANFHLQNGSEAYSAFRRVNAIQLPPDIAYEYAWSFYSAGKYGVASKVFSTIPENHALTDLSNFYGALCAIELNQPDDAIRLLDKIVILPDRLTASKDAARTAALALKQRQGNHGATKSEKQRTSQASSRPTQSVPLNSTPKKLQLPHTPPGTQLKALKTVQESDFHGYGRSKAVTEGGIWLIDELPQFSNSDGSITFGIPIHAETQFLTKDGRIQRLQGNQGEEFGILRLVSDPPKTAHERVGLVGIAPFLEFSLGSFSALGVEAFQSYGFPKFEKTNRFGERGASASFVLEIGDWKSNLSVTSADLLDSKDQSMSNSLLAEFRQSLTLSDGLSGSASLYGSSIDYYASKIDGPDSVAGGSFGLSQSLPIGFSISGKLVFENHKNYNSYADESVTTASGTMQSGKCSLAFSPFDWLHISTSAARNKFDWNPVGNEESRSSFRRNVADYIDTQSGEISLNLRF